ncbi:succinate dehydrogenase/fumarate reductase flavo protein subunit [Rhizodiscina lignyota]|uniref:Succinate dehydrogenase/fumarate reductase flavo protein subunit n=1 Tax=Rhizodiscina lignyota TaxID=1504668 RepID=A0A9P4IPH6_9PEZI|nr:succinate dehydrogenase/fumarate reductase flavo protein subunit [Rhizodiscina lignyota]
MGDYSYDLIVLGSGFAGCMTTLNYLETCKKEGVKGRVALVEAGKQGERCGASRWTMAYLRLDKNLGFDSDWKKEMDLVSKGLADQDYCKKLEQEAQKTAEFVQDHGVKFNHHDEKNVLLEFNTDQHFVFPDGGGHAIINALMSHIDKFPNCDVHWETEGRHLLMTENGKVRGLQVRKSDGLLYELHAPNVMLSCGGFEANREMLARYVGNRTHDLPLIAPGLKYNKGAGLQMALEVGAATSGSFDGIHCELVDTRATKPDAVIWGHNYGILVDEHSKRFFDEGRRELFATFEIAALELWRDHNSKGYFITDKTVMDRFRPGWVYDTTDQEPEKADTIKELAEKLGLKPDELEKTVSDFNKACNDKPFDLMKLDGKATTGLTPDKTNWANPIDKAPFYGYPVTSHLTFTYGGIKVNLDSQVLGTNDVPIPGLYAAGELTGVFYNEYPPATSVLRSLTFGRLAGTALAEQLAKKHAGGGARHIVPVAQSNL